MHLHFLHGFLGQKNDWNIFDKKFTQCINHTYSIEKFLPNARLTPDNNKTYFDKWVNAFNSEIFSNKKFINSKNILIGYSLGGRLALHSLFMENSWDAAIIISANPGLTQEDEKISRSRNDELWAQRFLTEDWETLMESWNSQGVFSGKKSIMLREEKDFTRKNIAEILLKFSLGKQKNLRKKIVHLDIPILWIAGENDSKFCDLANEMSRLNKNITSLIFPNCGHRVPWENPEGFVEECNKFISLCDTQVNSKKYSK